MSANIETFFHPNTFTLSYVVYDKPGGHAVIIDSALDYDSFSGTIETQFADSQVAFIRQKDLTVDWLLETHAHADHVSAAAYLKTQLNSKIGVGKGIIGVQQTFKQVFNIPDSELIADGKVFDRLFEDGESFQFGELQCRILATPGHTNDSIVFLIEDNAFIGDTLFMPDSGTARCDFPGGDAALLFDSIEKIHQLPEQTKLWMCHDYQPNGRELQTHTTVATSKKDNIHVGNNNDKDTFIELRNTRDSGLKVPKLLYPAVQINIRGGNLPKPESNGSAYVKIPLNFKSLTD